METTLAVPTPTDGHARPPWTNAEPTHSLIRNQGVSVPLRSALFFKGNCIQPSRPPKTRALGSDLGQWSWEVGSAPKVKQNFLLEEKVRLWGRGSLGR